MLSITCIPAVYVEQEMHLQGSGNITNVDETRKARALGLWLVDVETVTREQIYKLSTPHGMRHPATLCHTPSRMKIRKSTANMTDGAPTARACRTMSHHTIGM
jgi:hypothetical protein